MPRISPEIRIGLRASATRPAMPSPNRTSAPAPLSPYPRVAIVTRTPGFGRHENHRVLEPEALFKRLEHGIDQRLEAIGALNALPEILQRLHREDRILCRG